jgi:hypothetical protein
VSAVIEQHQDSTARRMAWRCILLDVLLALLGKGCTVEKSNPE